MARAFIGTSGWSYEGWRRDFYAGVPRSRWLEHCARRFTGLEINGTHYRLQPRRTFEAWRARVPEGFVFTVKANRYLTQYRRLVDPAEPVRREREGAEGLGQALGAVLWQLPARFERDDERLARFLAVLVEGWPVRHAVELRHRSWFEPGTEALLRGHGVAVCISHAGAFPMWEAVTSDFVYVRLHGAPKTYVSEYGPRGLRPWAGRVEAWLAAGLDVHVYFDNDVAGAAPRDAERLMTLLGVRPGQPVPREPPAGD